MFLIKPGSAPVPPSFGEARYPAVSPDQSLLAYSHAEAGTWNLWLFDRATQQRRRIGNVPCNEVEPAWEADSRTLLYTSDCGRALGLTAICRRTLAP